MDLIMEIIHETMVIQMLVMVVIHNVLLKLDGLEDQVLYYHQMYVLRHVEMDLELMQHVMMVI